MILKYLKARLIINRFKSGQEKEGTKSTFLVPVEDGATALQALQYIYEQFDPTLAFAYSCRYGRCGLCGVIVNERPVLACTTFIRADEINVKPLTNLPLVRDLVIDREPLEAILKEQKIYYAVNAGEEAAGPGLVNISPGFETIRIPSGMSRLASCLECLCCHSACPNLDPEGANLDDFAGPFIFLKLAQLHLDPRDHVDRKAQARRLGIEKCLSCKGCYCPQGIAVYREAIQPLLP